MRLRFWVLFSIAVLPFLASAASEPQELHIYANGRTSLTGAEIITKHALNLFAVRVWGQKWMIVTDYPTTFESKDGVPIKLEDLALGHIINVQGRPVTEAGTIEAASIKDISIVKKPLVSSEQAAISTSLASPIIPPVAKVEKKVKVIPPKKPAAKKRPATATPKKINLPATKDVSKNNTTKATSTVPTRVRFN